MERPLSKEEKKFLDAGRRAAAYPSYDNIQKAKKLQGKIKDDSSPYKKAKFG